MTDTDDLAARLRSAAEAARDASKLGGSWSWADIINLLTPENVLALLDERDKLRAVLTEALYYLETMGDWRNVADVELAEQARISERNGWAVNAPSVVLGLRAALGTTEGADK